MLLRGPRDLAERGPIQGQMLLKGWPILAAAEIALPMVEMAPPRLMGGYRDLSIRCLARYLDCQCRIQAGEALSGEMKQLSIRAAERMGRSI